MCDGKGWSQPPNWYVPGVHSYFRIIKDDAIALYKRERLGFLFVLIEMRHYFLKTI